MFNLKHVLNVPRIKRVWERYSPVSHDTESKESVSKVLRNRKNSTQIFQCALKRKCAQKNTRNEMELMLMEGKATIRR